jgi:sterol desaturase/sphingolipid hydroxylase (fatty acid hydroxylase superfamily)
MSKSRHPVIRGAIRYGAYPVVFGLAAATVLWLIGQPSAPWLGFGVVTVLGFVAVAGLERAQPFHRGWQVDQGDTLTDAMHTLVNQGLLTVTALALQAGRAWVPHFSLWPDQWPLWGQILLAGTVLDLGLYVMHRLSHRVPWLWRLHAIHHSAQRLYWMKLAVVLLGAPALIVGAWLTLLSVHLAFQHANLDYSVGPLRSVLGVAQSHRWHHKREFEDAQVNFGEFWLVWDHLFGTYHDAAIPLGADEVGLRESGFPKQYLPQLRLH